MIIIKFWLFQNDITVAEGVNLKSAFWDLLYYYPDFLEKIACFELDELDRVVEQDYLTLEDAECCDFSGEDEEGNITYYSFTDDGAEELLFRAKHRNNYNYEISKF